MSFLQFKRHRIYDLRVAMIDKTSNGFNLCHHKNFWPSTLIVYSKGSQLGIHVPPGAYLPVCRVLLQPLQWCSVDCVINHERDVREEQKYMYVARTSNYRVISSGDIYCCLLPRCEDLRTCRSGFPIATKWCCVQDVKVVQSSVFTQRTCDRCGSL